MKNFFKQVMGVFTGEKAPQRPHHYDLSDGDEGIDDESMLDEEGIAEDETGDEIA